MKSFKDTRYGDLTGKAYKGDVIIQSDIKSLKGSPKIVEGDYKCLNTDSLKDLKGAPETVEGEFEITNARGLETLKGAPKKCKTFDCSGCKKLTTLDPLLRCDIEEVVADKHLLDDYKKKKKIIEKHGYDKAKEVFDMLDNLI